MIQILLCILMFAGSAFAQTDKDRLELFKKETATLRALVNDAVNSSVPGRGIFEDAKATYLDGYGIVVSLEVALEPTRNPFSSPKSPGEVRASVSERRKMVQTKLETLLKERVGKMDSVDAAESVTIVLHLFNSNPADLPDLPSQVIFTAKKQDPTHISIREF